MIALMLVGCDIQEYHLETSLGGSELLTTKTYATCPGSWLWARASPARHCDPFCIANHLLERSNDFQTRTIQGCLHQLGPLYRASPLIYGVSTFWNWCILAGPSS